MNAQHQHVTQGTCPLCLALLVQITRDRRRARLAVARARRRSM